MASQERHTVSPDGEVKGLPSHGPAVPKTVPRALPTDNQIIAFGERVTYVFASGKEVGSIHFDQDRGEIFYKGHNIRNMDLEEWHLQILEKTRAVLNSDRGGRRFASSYGQVLDKVILEKRG